MPEPSYILAAVFLAGALTWGMRALPFAALSRLRDNNLVRYLSRQMPLGVMVILALFVLKDVPTESVAAATPFVVAVTATVLLHLWRKNTLISIFGGTAVYMLLLALKPTI